MHYAAGMSWPSPEDLRREGAFACLDFVNSAWTDWRGEGEPTDMITNPRWWSRYFKTWGISAPGLSVPAGTRLAELRELREAMRRFVEKGKPPTGAQRSWLNRRLGSSPQRWTLSAGTAGLQHRLVPARADWQAVTAALILSFSQLVNDADPSRLKKCANPDCSYVFYDESANQSRRWCFSNVCGNLMHVRAFRARQ